MLCFDTKNSNRRISEANHNLISRATIFLTIVFPRNFHKSNKFSKIFSIRLPRSGKGWLRPIFLNTGEALTASVGTHSQVNFTSKLQLQEMWHIVTHALWLNYLVCRRFYSNRLFTLWFKTMCVIWCSITNNIMLRGWQDNAMKFY